MNKKVISLVVPMFNEGAGVRKFLDGAFLSEVLKLQEKYKTEVILVNDGSRDGTVSAIEECELKKKTETKLISFSRNFGKEIALTAGIEYATGEAVVMIDADGQHPAEAISEMVQRWERGAKVVTAVRKKNKTKHKLGSAIYYKMMHALGNKSMVEGAMDFRLIDREVADEYMRFTEHNRIMRGLVDWLGYPQEYLEVKIKGRTSGAATYDYRKLFGLALDSFVSMSRTPLLLVGALGMFIMFGSLVLGLFILVQQYILGDPLGLDWSGAVAMSVFISFLVGIVLVSQAVMALYISQIHTEAKNRPLFIIDRDKSFGIEEKKRR